MLTVEFLLPWVLRLCPLRRLCDRWLCSTWGGEGDKRQKASAVQGASCLVGSRWPRVSGLSERSMCCGPEYQGVKKGPLG